MRFPIRKIALLGIFSSIGIITGYIESLLVLPVSIPGVKIGISNCITIILLYLLGPWEALFVLMIRVVLSGALFGSLFSILYSLSGALVSYIIMRILYKCDKLSVYGVSAIGGVFHNIGQLLMAVILVSSIDILYYLPILILAGLIAGVIVGLVSAFVMKRIRLMFIKGDIL